MRRLIFAWTYFCGCQIKIFLCGFVFADGQISVISYLCLNKQKLLKDLDMKIVYIFSQCIYNKHFVFDFRKSFLLQNHYHYFHHLNVQECWKFCWARKWCKTATKKKESHGKKHHYQKVWPKNNVHKYLSRQEANEDIAIDWDWCKLI